MARLTSRGAGGEQEGGAPLPPALVAAMLQPTEQQRKESVASATEARGQRADDPGVFDQRQLRDVLQQILNAAPRETPQGASPESSPAAAPNPPGPQGGIDDDDDDDVAASKHRRKRVPLAWPARFDGDRAQFPAWRASMAHKLAADADVLGSDRDRFYLIFNEGLGPSAQRVAGAFYAAGGPDGRHDPDAFLAYLAGVYRDRHARPAAQQRLLHMKQGPRRPFADFYVDFSAVLADAGGLAWDDGLRLVVLGWALRDDLRRALVPVDLPPRYDDAVDVIMDVAFQLEHCRDDAPPAA